MSIHRVHGLFAVAIALSGSVAAGQVPAKAVAAPRRQYVVIVGASLSAGFADPTSKGADGKVNRTYRLDVAFKKAWPRKLARVSNFGDLVMFMDPLARGRKQIAAARRRKPDLLLGVDFMVWFGYGSSPGVVRKGEVDDKRLALQKKGLALLDGLDCPILLGDYPDMHGASPHMLPRRMIPNRATLKALNARLRAWAGKRKDVHVFPLSKFVEEAVTQKQSFPFGKGKVVLPKNYLLQSDRLHATRVGTLVVVLRVAQTLPEILPKNHPLLRPKITFERLIKAADLEDALPEPPPQR